MKALDEAHRAQCVNYLKASGLHLCLLLNFGKPRLEINAWRTACALSSICVYQRASAENLRENLLSFSLHGHRVAKCRRAGRTASRNGLLRAAVSMPLCYHGPG